MPKHPDISELWEDAEDAEPGSRLRARTSDDDRIVDELHARWSAGELSVEELAEQIKDICLARAREEFSEADFREFEYQVRNNLELPNLDLLRRRQ